MPKIIGRFAAGLLYFGPHMYVWMFAHTQCVKYVQELKIKSLGLLATGIWQAKDAYCNTVHNIIILLHVFQCKLARIINVCKTRRVYISHATTKKGLASSYWRTILSEVRIMFSCCTHVACPDAEHLSNHTKLSIHPGVYILWLEGISS